MRAALSLLVIFAAGCRGASWDAPPGAVAPASRVAAALEDDEDASDEPATDLPDIAMPRRVRPCCAFGMDLDVDLKGVSIPGYQIGNILDAEELRGHSYDNGVVTVSLTERPVAMEPNGLVYTCRGGFIDVAHVRDNADLVLYLATAIAKKLPEGGTIEAPGDGAKRTITIAKLPAEDVDALGRLEVAIAIAQWVAYDFSVWHELATWHGYESTPGFSEKISAFSPEDLYSNLLGIRVAGGVLREGGYRSRAIYDSLMDGWLAAALQRLHAQPKAAGRSVMKALDGRLWDSTLRVPDPKLVKRRFFPPGQPVAPWRLEDTLGEEDVAAPACRGTRALPLRVADRVGAILFEDTLAIRFEPGAWAGATFPFPEHGSRVVTHETLSDVVAATRASMKSALGEGFDRPR